jgi:hypothetical protein
VEARRPLPGWACMSTASTEGGPLPPCQSRARAVPGARAPLSMTPRAGFPCAGACSGDLTSSRRRPRAKPHGPAEEISFAEKLPADPGARGRPLPGILAILLEQIAAPRPSPGPRSGSSGLRPATDAAASARTAREPRHHGRAAIEDRPVGQGARPPDLREPRSGALFLSPTQEGRPPTAKELSRMPSHFHSAIHSEWSPRTQDPPRAGRQGRRVRSAQIGVPGVGRDQALEARVRPQAPMRRWAMVPSSTPLTSASARTTRRADAPPKACR